MNEVVYVSEVVAMMQCDQGNFSPEQYLRVASEFLIQHLNLDEEMSRLMTMNMMIMVD